MLEKNSQKFYFFKKILKLKIIIQKKTLIKKLLKLKKKKWNFFLKSLTYSLNFRKTYKLFDVFKYSLKKKGNGISQKKKYLYSHNSKQLIKMFYGNLLTSYIKKLSKKYSKEFFLKLESRLDTILYRSHFSSSIFLARKLIHQGFVYVNDKQITQYSFFIKEGDVVSLKKQTKSNQKFFPSFSNIWPVFNENLIINFSTFEILYINKFQKKKIFKNFYYYINLNLLNLSLIAQR